MINIQKMMQQAQQVQFKLQEMQEKLKDINVSGEAGGGMVKVVMSCAGFVQSVQIDPSLLNTGSKDMLEDLVTAAHNNAAEAKEAKIKEETQSMMESMGLPADSKLPF
jgi:DNA-binding YbaB/EbfC family protein